MKAKIIEAREGWYGATTANTGMSQRDKLEETMRNLATVLGAKVVRKACIQDGSYIYAIGSDSYQSASNLILDLSRKIVGQRS
jgi:hypothetical protein